MEPIDVISTDKNVAAIHGRAPDPGTGVFGETAGGGQGVRGVAATIGHGVQGESAGGRGVVGVSKTFFGVSGQSTSGVGVSGESSSADGVQGVSQTGVGVHGDSKQGEGVRGFSHNPNHGGVVGVSDQPGGTGVFGTCDAGNGVVGESKSGVGGVFISQQGQGVRGFSPTGVGVFGQGGRLAGLFVGSVEIEGDVKVAGNIDCPTGTVHCFDVNISNADCAEEFEAAGAEPIEPGTLMSFGIDGTLRPSLGAYDNKVVGVISGAGEYKPGIVLDKQHGGNRVPIALLGKVYCKVDAGFSAIKVGDLLTTSPTAGHAMKATDPVKAFGSVIGKALRPQSEGRGMIPILVALQ